MDFDRLFPHRVCINLDRRPERWRRAARHLAQRGVGVDRWPAVDGLESDIPRRWPDTAGAYGCLRSHLEVVRHARRQGWPSVFIFEDDVVLGEDFARRFRRWSPQIPQDWEMLWLGGFHRGPVEGVSPHLFRLSKTLSTYAYGLRASVFDAFVELNESRLEPVDTNNVRLQKRGACYGFLPHLAWVHPGDSDAQEMQLDPWWLKHSLVLAGPAMERLERSTGVVICQHRSGDPSAELGNLRCAADTFSRFLPGCRIVVVEQGATPLPGLPKALPKGVQRVFLPKQGPFDKGRCCNLGLEALGADRDYWIFAQRDYWVRPWFLKAALRQAQRHDFVSALEACVDISPEHTRKLWRLERVPTLGYRPRTRASLCAGFSIFTKSAVAALGGWPSGSPEEADSLQSERIRRRLELFETPGCALRMSDRAL